MEKTVRYKLLLVFILIVAGILLACALYLTQPPEEIIIGFSGPLEGKYSDMGIEGRNAALLAIEELNAKGGINGRQLRLISTHDGILPEDAVEADKKLLSQGAIAIIGHMTSTQTLAVLDAGVEALYVAPTPASYRLSGRDDNLFRVISDNAATGQSLGKLAAHNGIKTAVAIMDISNEEFSRTYIDAAIRGFTSEGGTILATIPFASTDSDSSLKAAQIAVDSKAQAVFLASSARDTARILIHMSQLNYSGAKYSSSWALTPALVAQGGSAVEGTIFCHPYPVTPQRKEHKEFIDKFYKRFGWLPSYPGVFGYSAATLLITALKHAEEQNIDLRAALKSIREHDGLTSIIMLDDYGDAHMPVFTSMVKNGVVEDIP